MINRYFQVDAPGTDAMHADPIAALAALKLASLAVTRGTLRTPVRRSEAVLHYKGTAEPMYTRSAE